MHTAIYFVGEEEQPANSWAETNGLGLEKNKNSNIEGKVVWSRSMGKDIETRVWRFLYYVNANQK